jgi:hypothetical protein
VKNKVAVKYSLWKFLFLLSFLSGSFVFLYLGYIWFPQNIAVYGDVMESKKAQIPQCNEISHEDEQYIKTLATFLRCEVEKKGNREQLFALPRKLSPFISFRRESLEKRKEEEASHPLIRISGVLLGEGGNLSLVDMLSSGEEGTIVREKEVLGDQEVVFRRISIDNVELEVGGQHSFVAIGEKWEDSSFQGVEGH